MKFLTFAFTAVSLAFAAPAMADGPAMKAANSMKMESHDKMSGNMAGEKKDAMKPMAMKQTGKKPVDAMAMQSGSMKADKGMKH